MSKEEFVWRKDVELELYACDNSREAGDEKYHLFKEEYTLKLSDEEMEFIREMDGGWSLCSTCDWWVKNPNAKKIDVDRLMSMLHECVFDKFPKIIERNGVVYLVHNEGKGVSHIYSDPDSEHRHIHVTVWYEPQPKKKSLIVYEGVFKIL